jgi:hypothetical protein
MRDGYGIFTNGAIATGVNKFEHTGKSCPFAGYVRKDS